MINKTYALGLMSGTSCDGLDVAYCEIHPSSSNIKTKLLAFKTYSYPKELKDKILKSFNSLIYARDLCSLNFELAIFYANQVNQFIKEFDLNKDQISFIASHGQTIYHLIDPKDSETKSTLQLGDISVLSQLTQLNVIGDFRPSDIANNGQGAPLVPCPEWLLFHQTNKVLLFQNIGGISNVSVINNDPQSCFAFDNGPGNVLIDLAVKHFFNLDYDANGDIAVLGKINHSMILYLLNDNYYDLIPPKSTGREKYSINFFNQLLTLFPNVDKYDFVASVTYFTALVIANSYKQFIIQPDTKYQVYLSGGGASNSTLVNHLKKLLNPIKVYSSSKLNINPDAKEAIAFAILGYLTFNHLPGNLPSATGADKPCILGKIAYYK
ncbi:anhydro-N-acetylmuramic acid kinase [Mycoplasma sp. NEAQ87857]|uniref:anhydro-N-acetylmuramic acid kinase n=1 Tax=Mycoplasma sp. NEAQ87857 TaxID=2683967 RepID=UPI001315DEA0|nr:anhydro-N-acetylmuramic acid kinase [Mycoplasma sp. NEAQ87857]QGZ97517.1 anhydro-N-acetylmuramic acid kinase [Mycoplasma sp. NEAQ87857]